MKVFIRSVYRLTIISLMIIPGVMTLIGCNSRHAYRESRKVDSLIVSQKINERCILVKFGSDAVTAINTSKGIVIIDAGISTGLTSRYKKIIEDEFPGKVFSYVIMTHGHHDHYSGNGIFAGSKMISHVKVPAAIAEQMANPEKRALRLSVIVENLEKQLQALQPGTEEWNELFTQKIRCRYAWKDTKNQVQVIQPDVIFDDSLYLDMGDTSFEITWFGKAHSDSDILIYVPEMSLLFTGDLFFKYGKPAIDDTLVADSKRLQQSLHWLEQRMGNIGIIIGGHGQIISVEDLKSFILKIGNLCEKGT